MKKKLLIGTILPSIAALAVIGSGFSLWIFNDSSSVEATGSVGINVTKVLDITNSSIGIINKDAKLIFDQTTEGANGINPNGNGLWWGNDSYRNAIQGAFFSLNDPSNTSYATAYDTSVNYIYTTTITLSQVLASYVKLSLDSNYYNAYSDFYKGTWTDGKTSDEDGSVTYKFECDSKNTFKAESQSDIGKTFFAFDILIPTYQNGMEPTTLGENDTTEHSYLKMLKDIKGESISVTYEVKATIEA